MIRRLLVAVLAVLPFVTLAQGGFSTPRWDTELQVQPDGVLNVRETIAVNFSEPRRGLIRLIPEVTRSTSSNRVRTVNLRVLSASLNGRSALAGTSRKGGDLEVRIGDPDRRITGPATIVLDYEVRYVLTPNAGGTGNTELLWNATPSDWATDIESATVSATFPPSPEAKVRVLLGGRGERKGLEIVPDGKTVGRTDLLVARMTDRSVRVSSKVPIPRGSLITFGLSLPDGVVDAPAPKIESAGNRDAGMPSPPRPSIPLAGLLPLASLPILYFAARRRFAEPAKPLVVRFDPPQGVGPSLSGVVFDSRVDSRDVVAGIVSLAQKGALRIHHGSDNSGVTLEMKGLEKARGVDDWESMLYRYLAEFGEVVTPDMLRGSFGQSYRVLASALEAEGIQRQLYRSTTENPFGCLFWFLLVGGGLVGLYFRSSITFIAAIAAIIGGIWIMRKVTNLTSLGQKVKWELSGLYEFINRAHRKELNYMAERDPDQALFEKLLPYAVSFGLVKQWTDAFQGIDLQMPEWYAGDPYGNLWTAILISDLMDMGPSYGSAMSALPETSSFGTGDLFSSGDSGFGGGFDSGSGGFGGGFGGGDGGGGGGGDSW